MDTILRNDTAESLILDIRSGRNAALEDLGDGSGAFLVFPTSVVTPGPGDSQLVYPLRCDLEPGAAVTIAGEAQVGGVIAGVTIAGSFQWRLDEMSVPVASYRFRRRGRDIPPPRWATQLPRSQLLAREGSAGLARRRCTLGRRAEYAERELLSLSDQVMRHACRGPVRRALNYRAVIDVDDVVQRSLQTACRLLPLYTSKERPPCSWLGMLRLDARRDMFREVSRLDWLPEDVAAAVTMARACGVDRHADPSATLAALEAAADGLGVPMPRVAAPQLDAAFVGRAVMTWETGFVRTVPGPECRDGERRRVLATMAGLVTDDGDIAARAAAGDPRALARVGDQLARRLADRDESVPAARRRCWDQFQRSGRLFTSPQGLDRFGSGREFATLAAMDASLRRAAGIARRWD